jgi:hypothetical protein
MTTRFSLCVLSLVPACAVRTAEGWALVSFESVSITLAEFSISVVAIRDFANRFGLRLSDSLFLADAFFTFLVSTFESPIAILGLHLWAFVVTVSGDLIPAESRSSEPLANHQASLDQAKVGRLTCHRDSKRVPISASSNRISAAGADSGRMLGNRKPKCSSLFAMNTFPNRHARASF